MSAAEGAEGLHIYLDGSVISDMKSFYEEADRKLTKDFVSGRNFAAFNDLLRGGFGLFRLGEPIVLHWTDFTNSSGKLGNKNRDILVDIIRKHNNVTFVPEDPETKEGHRRKRRENERKR